MKKIISFISIIIFVMALATLTSFGVVGYAESESQEIYYEENLYDFNDNVTYLLRYKNDGGYYIIHQESGVVCEYDEFNVSPYNGEIGKLYYGGPGVYLSMPSKFVGKISPMQYFGITQEENASLEAINSTFIEQAQSMEPFTITSNDGYTLINNYAFIENYSFTLDIVENVNAIKLSAIVLLRYYDSYHNSNYILDGVVDSILANQLSLPGTTVNNLSICSGVKQGLIGYFNNYTSGISPNVTYTILSPRNDILSGISSNKPSIIVMTNSYSDNKCNVVYGYSGNYYRIKSTTSCYNVNRSYVYGGIFIA